MSVVTDGSMRSMSWTGCSVSARVARSQLPPISKVTIMMTAVMANARRDRDGDALGSRRWAGGGGGSAEKRWSPGS
jgi:hypothetical protein